MAIIKCPECQKEISCRAVACPHCGFPLAGEFTESVNSLSDPDRSYRASAGKNIKKIAGMMLGVFAIIAIIIFAVDSSNNCDANGCHNTRVTGGKYCSKHTCGKIDCFNYTSSGEYYCYLHRSSDTSTSSYSYESAYSALQFSNIEVTSNSSYTICTGTITNNGKKTYSFVEVKGSLKDSSGTVVDTDWTYAAGSEGLSPGESTTFRLSVDKNYKIVSCSVSLLDYKAK